MNDDYLLGHDDEELRRLEDQARVLAPPTHAILTLAGIEPGMRVLDLGSGAGDVALAVSELVGASGSVVGIDQSAAALARARERCAARSVANITFLEGDLHDVEVSGTFDAVVGRLVLLYAPNPALVLKRFADLVRPGGVVVAMEYEMTAAGMLPSEPLAAQVVSWICEAFRRSGLDPLLGARLGDVFNAAGLGSPTVLGMQRYLPPGDPLGPRMASEVVRTLLPVIERTGIATAREIGIDTLQQRTAAAQSALDAMFKPPTLVGAWARVA